jgi:hypothetical protein
MEVDRVFRSWQEQLRASLHQWQDSGEDAGALLRGGPLAEAETWLAQREPDLSQAELQFIMASLAGRRRTQRLRSLAVAGLFVIAVAMAILAISSNRNARAADASAAIAQTESAKAAEAEATAKEAAVLAQAAATAEAEARQDAEARRVDAENANATAVAERDNANNANATAVAERDNANKQAQIVLARQLVAESELAERENLDQLPLSILLAVEAMRRFEASGVRWHEADLALRRAISFVPQTLTGRIQY